MVEAKDLRRQIERIIERAQADILDASRQLADGIQKETDRFVSPASQDLERLIDDVFDFTEKVVKRQRKLVNEVVKSFNEQSRRAAEAGRTATSGATKRLPIKRLTTKTAAKKRATKKATAKKATAKKATAKKATAKKARRPAPPKKA